MMIEIAGQSDEEVMKREREGGERMTSSLTTAMCTVVVTFKSTGAKPACRGVKSMMEARISKYHDLEMIPHISSSHSINRQGG